MKIVLIGPVELNTGIGWYCRRLYPAIGRLVETEVIPVSLTNNFPLLEERLQKISGDVALIEHTYGLYHHSAEWNLLLSHLKVPRVLVRPHTVFHPEKWAFRQYYTRPHQFPEIIVHTQGQGDLLHDVDSPLYHIPHGFDPYQKRRENKVPRIIQFGYGRRDKGWLATCRAAQILRRKGLEFTLTLLYGQDETGAPSTPDRIANCLRDNEIEADFRHGVFSEEEISKEVARSDIAVFPFLDYGDDNAWGASGSARFAMSRGAAVLTSNVPLFEGLEVPKFKALSNKDAEEMLVTEYAEALEAMIVNKAFRKGAVKQQKHQIEKWDWESVAAMHVEVFKG